MRINELGQPIGQSLPGWTPRLHPTAAVLTGRYCRLERLDPHRHGDQLYTADQLDTRGEGWTYLPYGPLTTPADHRRWVELMCSGPDPLLYAIIDTDSTAHAEQRAVGILGLLRLQPEVGVIEVGHVHYSPVLQRRRAATEAQYLLAAHVFDELGYRRLEWKCDALNAASRSAAERLGFTFEGTFRQATVVKGRSRDTAWYSIIDNEWPLLRARFASWLHPDNFDSHGHQQTSLGGRSAGRQFQRSDATQ